MKKLWIWDNGDWGFFEEGISPKDKNGKWISGKEIPDNADIEKCSEGWDWEQNGICTQCSFYREGHSEGNEPYVVGCLIEDYV